MKDKGCKTCRAKRQCSKIAKHEVEVMFDDDGLEIRKGTKVMFDGATRLGIATAVYDNGTVDINHSSTVDTFSIINHDVRVVED